MTALRFHLAQRLALPSQSLASSVAQEHYPESSQAPDLTGLQRPGLARFAASPPVRPPLRRGRAAAKAHAPQLPCRPPALRSLRLTLLSPAVRLDGRAFLPPSPYLASATPAATDAAEPAACRAGRADIPALA